MYHDPSQTIASKYVIYCRKSNEGDEKQATSLEDQRTRCEKLAEELGLKVVAVIEEAKSAKDPGNRPKFRKLLDEIEAGEVDGIIAWHPDRLARNMREGGEVIDLVDRDRIIDLRFCTQQFSKDANGKMLLGLAFVLSKQYSDKLSADVIRGRGSQFLRGQTMGYKKHGYQTGDLGSFAPNQFHGVIRRAWEMRMAGAQYKEILDYLEKEDYHIIVKKTGERQVMTDQKLTAMFRDTFYYGVWVMSEKGVEQEMSLHELPEYKPVISEAEWHLVQKNGRIKTRSTKDDMPLRGKVFDESIQILIPGRTEPSVLEYKPTIQSNNKKGKKQTYIYFSANSPHKKLITSAEERKSAKSIRAKAIVEAVGQMLAEQPKLTKARYQKLLKATEAHLEELFDDRQSQITQLKKLRTRATNECQQIISTIGALVRDRAAGRDRDDEIAQYEREKALRQAEIEQYSSELAELEKSYADLMPTFEHVLNLLETLQQQYLSMSGVKKLEIADLLVSNLIVRDGKVRQIRLAEPFDLVFGSKFLIGRSKDLALKPILLAGSRRTGIASSMMSGGIFTSRRSAPGRYLRLE